MSINLSELEKRLWSAADELRANSDLTAAQYSAPVLGLIFLRFADVKFIAAKKEVEAKGASGRRGGIGKEDYHARGVLYLPEEARYSTLLNLPESINIGANINEAMKAIERENEELKDILPKTYQRFSNSVLVSLLKNFNSIPMDIEGDVFGKIYEYFLGNFAKSEGQRGGEFFTPTSIVKLIVEIIEPFHGRIFDPACGSGGMFVQCANFVENHKKAASEEISVYGEERVMDTVRLCKMNLAVHGLSGDIKQGNSYYDDLHDSRGKFDFVMANPPFNVDNIDKDRIKDDKRFPFGMPKVDNGNYLWIELFYSSLNDKGRAGFVMANSASDARGSELEIRKKLIESGAVDVIVAIGPNFFFTVTLPCTLWFLDKAKRALPPSPPAPLPVGEGGQRPGEGKQVRYRDTVLFIDARHIFTQVTRALREFTPEQVEFIANIVRLYRGESVETLHATSLQQQFRDGKYQDVPGLCKVATIKDIEAQGWSLNPGRYVGVAPGHVMEDVDFTERLEELNEELIKLNLEARELEERIQENVGKLLEGAA